MASLSSQSVWGGQVVPYHRWLNGSVGSVIIGRLWFPSTPLHTQTMAMASGTRIKQTCLLSWEAGSRLAVRIKHGNTRQGLWHSELSLPDKLSPQSHRPAAHPCSSTHSPTSQESCTADLIFAAYAHKTGTAPTAPEDADTPGYLRDASAAPLKLGH